MNAWPVRLDRERKRRRCTTCGSASVQRAWVPARNGGRLCLDCADTFSWYSARLRRERAARQARKRGRATDPAMFHDEQSTEEGQP